MMDKKRELFKSDLQKIYLLLQERQNELNGYFNILKGKKEQKREFIDNFLLSINLSINDENRLALINRLVSLRDDSLVQAMEKEGFSEDRIIEVKEEAYLWVSDYHTKLHEKLLHKIESLKLLTPFYRAVLKGVHEAGVAMSRWQSSWTAHIINGVNRELYRVFNGDEEKIFEMLNEKELFDKDESREKADRSYSVLIKTDEGYKSIPYAVAFKDEVEKVSGALKKFRLQLSVLDDEIYNQKEEYLRYLDSLIEAFQENDKEKLIKRWADVDRTWMKITTPLQIGHPLEYYEDHYKKAVALEWDIRIANPDYTQNSTTKDSIEKMFIKLYDGISPQKDSVKDKVLKALSKIQLYIGRPMFYYGAEFCGLFSAQVVPNDENVSKECGKKIFAFSDNVLDSLKAKPTLKIHKMIFGDDFIEQEKELIFKKEKIWHKIYDITTIGHEFGHILWMDDDTETVMNKTGNFKNIEEFKATTGGLTAFFEDEKKELKEYILRDVVKRAVTLIAWKEVGEVEPYYCEGLIHLHILFKSGVLSFEDEKLSINLDRYEEAKNKYKKIYTDLAEHYLSKSDATLFLENFAKKEGKYFMPVDKEVYSFVSYYYELYKEIGRVIL